MMYLFALIARRRRGGLVALLCCAGLVFSLWAKPLAAAIPLAPGGPILLITTSDNFSDYYQEILFNEGLNAFAVETIGSVNAGVLANHDVAILAPLTPPEQLTAAQVTMFSNWVNAGGRLIAMRPDKQLAGLLGLTDAGATLSNGYLLITDQGLVNETIQFHGTADRYTLLSGTVSLATLYTDPSTPTANPAVTLRAVGAGQAAAFTYDLARSIVYTRQGNPAWAAQERDGFQPIRSDDKFYGNKAGDPQPDWINLNKVAIPQADEHQRLLANLILKMNVAKKPLPRFWYFPRGEKAVVLMTGDDHANNGTEGRFNHFKQLSPAGCSVPNWECVRGTSYVYPPTPLAPATASAFNAEGFEISLHLNTDCGDYTPASLRNFYDLQLRGPGGFAQEFQSLPAPITQRHHCIVWSDWETGAVVQLENGIRLDTSYYYWPPAWVLNRPGFFNGSGMPMRFTRPDGSRVDVYLTETQMTDESNQEYPFTIDTLLDRALGADGYYGVFTVNAHTDWNMGDGSYPISDAVVGSALARGVPVITARQLLTWLDGRNASKFGSLLMSGGGILNFTITAHPDAVGLQAMLPAVSPQGALSGLTRNSSPVSFTTQTIKGVQYALFSATGGSYAATYGSGSDTTPPTITAQTPPPGANGVAVGTNVTVTFSEAMNAATISGSTFQLRDPANALVGATVSYDAANLTATLTPGSLLAPSTTYTATVFGGTGGVKDLAGIALTNNDTWSFTTAAADTTAPTITSQSPANGQTNVARGTVVTATFSEAMNPATIGGSTFQLRDPANTLVTGAVTYNAASLTATLTPGSLLAPSTTYTATVFGGTGGVKDVAGNPLAANSVWSFTTAAVSGPSCPCTIWPSTAVPTVANDPEAVSIEVGVKFRADTDGFITGIRFYKGSSNTGTHVGTLWSAGGQQLGQATFTNETASGWQQVNFGTPVAIAANTVYVASYHTNVGRYAADETYFTSAVVNAPLTALQDGASGGNGVYTQSANPSFPTSTFNATNYWVDVVFVTDTGPDTTPPTVTATVPTAGATGVSVGTTVTATFSEPMNAATINGTNFRLLQGATPVAATVTYNAATRLATLTPSSALAGSTTYTASVIGGAGGVKDLAGNPLANASGNPVADLSWSFTTAAAGNTFTSTANQDGYVIESGETTNIGGTAQSGAATTRALRVGDTNNDGQQKSIVSFNTSAIPDGATILSATLRLRRGTVTGTNPFGTHGTCWVDVVPVGFSGNPALQTSDFQALDAGPGVPVIVQVTSLGNAAVNNAWSEGLLNAAGLAAIDKTGITQFRVYFALDDNDDTGTDEIGYYSGEAAAANRPQLVITYQVP